MRLERATDHQAAVLFARLALSASFLSAVGSRLGLWGKLTFTEFEAYTAEVNAFMPAASIPFLARAATVLEAFFGIALLMPFAPTAVPRGAAVLLALFATAIAVSMGIKSPLDYSVFSASACAWLLSQAGARVSNADGTKGTPLLSRDH